MGGLENLRGGGNENGVYQLNRGPAENLERKKIIRDERWVQPKYRGLKMFLFVLEWTSAEETRGQLRVQNWFHVSNAARNCFFPGAAETVSCIKPLGRMQSML